MFLFFILGLFGFFGWERVEVVLELVVIFIRKEIKVDIFCNILFNKFFKINMFCIRVVSCYLFVNEYGKYYYVYYYFFR